MSAEDELEGLSIALLVVGGIAFIILVVLPFLGEALGFAIKTIVVLGWPILLVLSYWLTYKHCTSIINRQIINTQSLPADYHNPRIGLSNIALLMLAQLILTAILLSVTYFYLHMIYKLPDDFLNSGFILGILQPFFAFVYVINNRKNVSYYIGDDDKQKLSETNQHFIDTEKVLDYIKKSPSKKGNFDDALAHGNNLIKITNTFGEHKNHLFPVYDETAKGNTAYLQTIGDIFTIKDIRSPKCIDSIDLDFINEFVTNSQESIEKQVQSIADQTNVFRNLLSYYMPRKETEDYFFSELESFLDHPDIERHRNLNNYNRRFVINWGLVNNYYKNEYKSEPLTIEQYLRTSIRISRYLLGNIKMLDEYLITLKEISGKLRSQHKGIEELYNQKDRFVETTTELIKQKINNQEIDASLPDDYIFQIIYSNLDKMTSKSYSGANKAYALEIYERLRRSFLRDGRIELEEYNKMRLSVFKKEYLQMLFVANEKHIDEIENDPGISDQKKDMAIERVNNMLQKDLQEIESLSSDELFAAIVDMGYAREA